MSAGRFEKGVFPATVPAAMYRLRFDIGGDPLLLFTNDHISALTGIDASEFLEGRRDFRDCILEEDRALVVNALSTADRDVGSVELRINHPAGVKWVLNCWRKVCETGEILIDGLMVDIPPHKAKRSDKRLREFEPMTAAKRSWKVVERDHSRNAICANGKPSETADREHYELNEPMVHRKLEEFRAAIDASSIVSIGTLDGTIKYANLNFATISQYTQDELVGQNHRIVSSGFHPREFWRDMWQTITRGKIWRQDVKNKRKDGTYYWVDTFIMPLKDLDDKVTEYLSIRNDITEKKENELRLQHALARAKQSDKLKAAFIANISHEIRTPMNAIMGLSELLARPAISQDRRYEYARLIYSRSQDLLKLFNNILEISRIEAGEVSLDFRDENISDFLRDIRTAYMSEAPHSAGQVPLLVHVSRSLQEQIVTADFGKLRQVLMNLLSNARKFTSRGSINLSCRSSEPGMLLFEVCDTGMGIDMGHQSKIFESFYQVSEAVHLHYGGSGLGLAICKGLVTSWGGQIGVESEPGKGSCFSFTLPFQKANSQVCDGADLLCGKSAIVIEDDARYREYVKEVLCRFGMKVATYAVPPDGPVGAEIVLVNPDIAIGEFLDSMKPPVRSLILLGEPSGEAPDLVGMLPTRMCRPAAAENFRDVLEQLMVSRAQKFFEPS